MVVRSEVPNRVFSAAPTRLLWQEKALIWCVVNFVGHNMHKLCFTCKKE